MGNQYESCLPKTDGRFEEIGLRTNDSAINVVEIGGVFDNEV
jgi:hypothetical protein